MFRLLQPLTVQQMRQLSDNYNQPIRNQFTDDRKTSLRNTIKCLCMSIRVLWSCQEVPRELRSCTCCWRERKKANRNAQEVWQTVASAARFACILGRQTTKKRIDDPARQRSDKSEMIYTTPATYMWFCWSSWSLVGSATGAKRLIRPYPWRLSFRNIFRSVFLSPYVSLLAGSKDEQHHARMLAIFP